MTKQEIINNFPVEFDVKSIVTLLIISFIVCLIVFLICALKGFIKEAFLISVVLLIAVGIISTVEIKRSEIAFIANMYDWKFNIFPKYYENLPLQKYIISEHSINQNGTISAVIESDKESKIITGVDNIVFIDEKKAYVTAVWIDDLNNYGISSDYYNVTIYLPKK